MTASKSRPLNISVINATGSQNLSSFQFNQTIFILLDELTGLRVIGQFNASGIDPREGFAPITISPSLTKIGMRFSRFNASLSVQNMTPTFALINVDYTGRRMNNITV